MDISAVIIQLVSQYPVIGSIIVVVGGLRLVLKPLFAAAHYYVEQTADPADDAKLAEVEQSKIVQGLFFVLDYLASVKIKQ
jgi:phage terminase Nu1 subunit (DNA packaging protein)